jgi:hypothetical protein
MGLAVDDTFPDAQWTRDYLRQQGGMVLEADDPAVRVILTARAKRSEPTIVPTMQWFECRAVRDPTLREEVVQTKGADGAGRFRWYVRFSTHADSAETDALLRLVDANGAHPAEVRACQAPIDAKKICRLPGAQPAKRPPRPTVGFGRRVHNILTKRMARSYARKQQKEQAEEEKEAVEEGAAPRPKPKAKKPKAKPKAKPAQREDAPIVPEDLQVDEGPIRPMDDMVEEMRRMGMIPAP